MADAFRCIAHIQKTHGRNGEVVAVPAHGLPLALRAGLEVAVVPPRLKGPRWRKVTSCEDSASGQLVALEGVRDLGHASQLVGRSLLARVRDLPRGLLMRDADALLGRAVRDVRRGDLGAIEEVLRGPAQDVWVVRGPYGEVLVPAVEPIVVASDPEDLAAPLVVDLPRGMVEDDAL